MVRRYLSHVVLVLVTVLAMTSCTSNPDSAGSAGAPAAPPPTSPSPSDPGASPTNTDQVGVIGDSLTAEMIDYDLLEPALIDAGWASRGIRMDGVWGRPIDGTGPTATTEAISTWREAGFDPRVWLVALGTNNAGDSVSQWRQDIRGVLNTINAGATGNYTIYWVTTGYLQPDVNNQDLFLSTVQEISADYPNVVVADYGAFLDEHRGQPGWESMWSDPVHHTKAGYQQLRTPFYVATLAPEAPA